MEPIKTTKFIINNVNERTQYAGPYKRIFNIINKGRMFCPAYETEKSKGLINGVYFLEVSESIEDAHLERILKLKNVYLENS